MVIGCFKLFCATGIADPTCIKLITSLYPLLPILIFQKPTGSLSFARLPPFPSVLPFLLKLSIRNSSTPTFLHLSCLFLLYTVLST